jgi:hypothetical protein
VHEVEGECSLKSLSSTLDSTSSIFRVLSPLCHIIGNAQDLRVSGFYLLKRMWVAWKVVFGFLVAI